MTPRLTGWSARATLALALALVLLAEADAHAATFNVRVSDFLYKPNTVNIIYGDTVRWKNFGPTDHTATQNGPLLWFDSGVLHAGDQYSFIFIASGGFLFHCTLHFNMTGLVSVSPTASPPSGSQGTVFTITVASAPAPTGFVYDILKKNPGQGFSNWQIGITEPSATFDSTGQTPGTYAFEARVRRTSDNISSLYSQRVTIVVNP